MHLPPYLSAVATPDKLGRNRTGKIKVTLDTEKLPKLGLTTASVYLSRFPGDKVGEEMRFRFRLCCCPISLASVSRNA